MVTYLGGGDISDGVPSEECNRLIERNTCLSGDEVQSNEVDTLRRLDVDISNKLVTVDNLRSVIGLITDNQEVVHTSSCLNVSQIRIDVIFEQCSCNLVVQFEQRGAGDLSDLSFDHEEEPSNVDAIECGAVSQSCLITEQHGSFTLEGNNGIDSMCIELVALSLSWVVRKFGYVTDLSTGETSW